MQQSQAQKKFLNLLNKVDYSKRLYEVFFDFCTLGTYSLALPFYPAIAKEELERVYKRYTHDQLVMLDEAFTVMVNEMEVTNADFLGEIYQQCEFGNARQGQFFTPYNVSLMMAQMTAGDLKKQIEEKHFLTLNEPTCGSGGMVIAFRQAMLEQHCNPSRDVFVVAQDISDVAFMMCYIQLSLYGMGAKVVHGNTLSMEIWRELYTPVYFITDWQLRLMLRNLSEFCHSPEEAKDKPAKETSPQQLDLF